MTKTDIIEKVAESCGITKKDSKEFVEATINAVIEGIASEGRVSIPGLGIFEKRQVDERICRNPQTGGQIVVPAHGSPKFKASKALKDLVK